MGNKPPFHQEHADLGIGRTGEPAGQIAGVAQRIDIEGGRQPFEDARTRIRSGRQVDAGQVAPEGAAVVRGVADVIRIVAHHFGMPDLAGCIA